MFTQLWVYLIAYFASHIVLSWQKIHHLPLDNQFVMNIHMIPETTLILAASYYYFKNPWKKKLTVVLWSIFILTWIVQVLLTGIMNYFHYADLTACFIISVTSVLALYEAFLNAEVAWRSQPEVYICIGLLAYYASSVPYIALMVYLQKYPDLNEYLFVVINGVLGNVRYLGATIAFWLIAKNKLKISYE